MVQIIENREPNRVVEFFHNKTVFITGGTGFLGKVLIEKLLRTCTQLKKIYVLVRAKKGLNPGERLQQIFDGPLFDLLKKQEGKGIFEKIDFVVGDMEAPDLGLSIQDRRKLIDEVEIIYHSAATVQFDESFKKSVLLNVRGTKLMLELGKECKNLLVFCHLSTAYCHENEEVLYEKTYPPPANPHKVINMCEWMDAEILDTIADKIRGSHANTYTFTKALGEGLVDEQMDTLPVIIQRPCAVVPIWKEPLPGWTDNLYGPTGLLVGGGKGVIKTLYGESDYFADYASVDVIVHAMICCAYDYATNKTRRVYNLIASDELKVTFQEILDCGREVVTTDIPFDWMLSYPGGAITHNLFRYYFTLIVFQLLPCAILDCFIFLFGYRPFLIRVQKKVLRGYKIFEYYANRKWDFRKNNMEAVRSMLNSTERKVFILEKDGFFLYDYLRTCTIGMRRYFLKEKDENIPAAKMRLKVLWFIDIVYKGMVLFACGYLFLKFATLSFFLLDKFILGN